MTNEERRMALEEARSKALAHARAAEIAYGHSAEDGPEANLAQMWSSVAQALKDGDPQHDAPSGRPAAMAFSVPDGVAPDVLTR